MSKDDGVNYKHLYHECKKKVAMFMSHVESQI